MRRSILGTAALVLLLSPFAAPAGAEHDGPHYSTEGRCGSDGEKALGVIAVTTPAATFYIDDRNYLLGNGFWIYQETNKVKFLQRGGKAVTGDPEICEDPAGLDPDALPEGYKPDQCIF